MMTNDEVRKEFEAIFSGISEHIGYNAKERMWIAYQAAHASQQAKIDALEAKLAENDTSFLIKVITDIREVTGVGYKPMLSELADAIKAKLAEVSKDAERLVNIAEYERVTCTSKWSVQVLFKNGSAYAYFDNPPSGVPEVKYENRLEALRAAVDEAIKKDK